MIGRLFQAESLRQEHRKSLKNLSACTALPEIGRALPHARRWVALDAIHEPAHRCLMRLYAQSGRGLGLKQYETLRQTLDREAGVEPDAETRQAL